MRVSLILVLVLVVSTSYALAQQAQGPQKTGDPFDLSSSREKLGKLGIPTQSAVSDLESKAKALVAANDCRNAIPALETCARQANTLANLISAGLQPFYGAGYDDRRKANVGPLAKYESLANDYKAKRNRAIVLQAECTAKLGQRDQAATLFINALNLLSVDDTEWWDRTRAGLYGFIDVK